MLALFKKKSYSNLSKPFYLIRNMVDDGHGGGMLLFMHVCTYGQDGMARERRDGRAGETGCGD